MRLHFANYLNLTKECELCQSNLEFAHFLILFLCEHGQCTKQQLFDLFASKIYGILDKIKVAQTIKMEQSESEIYVDEQQKYSFSFQLNRNQKFGEWTQRILAMSKEEKKEQIRAHFKRILKWLLNEKCFVLSIESEQKTNANPSKKRKLNDESPKYALCRRSFLHSLRSKAIFDFVLKKYDATHCEIVDVVLKNSLFALRRNFKKTLDAKWQSLNEREQQRQIFRHSVLDFVQMSPINNRFSIGRQPNNDEAEQYNLPFGTPSNEIYERMQGKVSRDELSAHLDVLCDGNNLLNELSDILPILLCESMESVFFVNVCGIMRALQFDDVRKCVHCRFDQIEIGSDNKATQSHDALRIFSAICSMHKIGDKQLSELCVIKHSTTKQILYRMLTEKYVQMEYIPRSNDRDPKKSFFVWSVNWHSLHKRVLHSMYNALCNLMTKRRSIRKQIEEIENDNSHKSSKQNRTKWKKLCAAFESLTMSIQKVDAQVALHRDF